MNKDITSGVKKVKDMTETEKIIERLKRDKNLLEAENKTLKKQLDIAIIENNYCKKIDTLFITVRTNIKMIVKRYKDSETKPPYYDMFVKLDKQIDEEMEIANEEENISF